MKNKRIWYVLFALYCFVMLRLLFDRAGYDPALPYAQQLKYNIVPFQTITRFLKVLLRGGSLGSKTHAIINLFGNVIMFIPLGFCLPIVRPRLNRFWKVILSTAVIITLVELTQLLTLVGSCDTDDLILNVLGSAMGYGFYRLFFRK